MQWLLSKLDDIVGYFVVTAIFVTVKIVAVGGSNLRKMMIDLFVGVPCGIMGGMIADEEGITGALAFGVAVGCGILSNHIISLLIAYGDYAVKNPLAIFDYFKRRYFNDATPGSKPSPPEK